MNLLPQDAQKILSNQYRSRLILLWLVVLGVTFVMSVLAYLPALIGVSAQEATLRAETEFLRESLARYRSESSGQVLSQAAHILETARFDYGAVTFIEILQEILKYDSESVSLTRFNFTRDKEGFSVNINGLAEERDDLVFLIDSLKRNAIFEDASVPISQFAKDKDLAFDLTLTSKQEQVDEEEPN